ncbi:MAG: choice-of-anchor D domain-containing protein [bacterium]
MVRKRIFRSKIWFFTLFLLLSAFISVHTGPFCRNAAAQVTDDSLEVHNGSQNDSYQNATILLPGEYPDLVCLDNDWYRITIPDTGDLAKANLRVTIQFSHAQGDLDMRLHSTSTTPTDYNAIDESALTSNKEVVSASLPPGDYLVRVFGFLGEINENYDMSVEILYACQNAPYGWMDISEGEQAIPLADDDYQEISIGFNFEFYGLTYNTVKVSSNGYLTFANEADPFFNASSPTPIRATHKNAPPESIFVYWTNLRPDQGGGIFYKLDESNPDCKKLIVEWRNVPRDFTAQGITFQVVLFECTNQIFFQYQDLVFSSQSDGYSLGAGATIGVADGRKTANSSIRIATEYLYKQPLLTNQKALMFTPSLDAPLNVLSSSPADGEEIENLNQGMEILFSQHLDESTLAGAFTIAPFVDGNWMLNQNRIFFDHSAYAFTEATSYEVTISQSLIRDVFGNGLFGGNYIVSFDTSGSVTPEPDIRVSPDSPYDFGDVDVNGTSELVVTIYNDGDADLVVSDITLSDTTNFVMDVSGGSDPVGSTTPSIDPNSSKTLSVSFEPLSEGTKSCTLTISSNDPDDGSVVLSLEGTGIGPEPDIRVTPDSPYDFGNVDVNGTSELVVTIYNDGDADLVVSDITLSDTTNFVMDVSGGSNAVGSTTPTIAQDSLGTLSVIFGPLSEGAKTCTLTITSNDPDNDSYVLSLQGTGMGPEPDIRVTPDSPYDFGNVDVNDTATAVITIFNDGDADLVVSGITLTDTTNFALNVTGGSNPVGSLTPTIAQDSSKTLGVIFGPLSEGAKTCTLTITSNDPDTPSLVFDFSGSTPMPPSIRVTPSTSHDFGNVHTNASSVLVITIFNDGDADLVVSDITLSDDTDFELDVTGGSNPVGGITPTIAQDSSKTLSIIFAPQSEGAKTCTLTITSNDPDNASVDLSLQGTGILAMEGWTTFTPDNCLGSGNCLTSPVVSAFLFDDNGTLWIGTKPYLDGNTSMGGGVCAYNLYTGAFACFDENDGLQGNAVIDIAKGPQGEIWIATESDSSGQGSGVSLYLGEGIFEGFGPSQMGLSENYLLINDIAVAPNGHLWIATFFDGLIEYDGEDWTIYSSTGEDLFQGESITFLNDYFTSILIDSSGRIWIGTELDGLYVKDPTGNSIRFQENLTGESISEISQDPNGNLWMVSIINNEHKLLFLGQNALSPLPIDTPATLAIVSNYIYDLFIHPTTGHIFIASDDGFYKYDGQGWSHFDLSNSGITSLYVNSVFVDPFGDYWIGTEEGFTHFNAAPPEIVGSIYGDTGGSEDLPVGTSIFVKFSEPMDRQSAESSFMMIDLDKGNTVSGTFYWNEDSTIMKFEPFSSLVYNIEYEVRIFENAKDRVGMDIDLNIGEGANFRSYILSTQPKPSTPSTTKPTTRNIYTGFFGLQWPYYNYTHFNYPYLTGFTGSSNFLQNMTSPFNLRFQTSPYSSFRYATQPFSQLFSSATFGIRNYTTPRYFTSNIYQTSYPSFAGSFYLFPNYYKIDNEPFKILWGEGF